ncbi:hypothetical protein ACFL6U_23755 [Planctomycetota bacterium]
MMREPMAQHTLKIQGRDLDMSLAQWLNSIEKAANDLKVATEE